MLKRINVSSLCRSKQFGCLNLTQVRTSFYNEHSHGPTKISNPDPDYIQWIKDFFSSEGLEFFKKECRRIFLDKPFRNTMATGVKADYTHIFEDFDSDEAIKRWKPVADSDSLNGFSVSNISRSPAGHALFHGVLCNRLPDDGVTMNSGFAGIIGQRRPRDKLVQFDTFWDWSRYNTLEIKFRGDGRKYLLIVNTASYMDDLSFYDVHAFPLYTRGGPHWQTFRIPFSKFIFVNKSLIQDQQGLFPVYHVKFVSITLQDKIDGPFALEIDYLGLRCDTLPFDEDTAYESYVFPHIRYKPLQVDCAPPEQNK